MNDLRLFAASCFLVSDPGPERTCIDRHEGSGSFITKKKNPFTPVEDLMRALKTSEIESAANTTNCRITTDVSCSTPFYFDVPKKPVALSSTL